jgi:hypothetical protein
MGLLSSEIWDKTSTLTLMSCPDILMLLALRVATTLFLPCLLTGLRVAAREVELIRPVRRGVSKGVEEDRRPPALQANHPQNGRKAFLGWPTRKA